MIATTHANLTAFAQRYLDALVARDQLRRERGLLGRVARHRPGARLRPHRRNPRGGTRLRARAVAAASWTGSAPSGMGFSPMAR